MAVAHIVSEVAWASPLSQALGEAKLGVRVPGARGAGCDLERENELPGKTTRSTSLRLQGSAPSVVRTLALAREADGEAAGRVPGAAGPLGKAPGRGQSCALGPERAALPGLPGLSGHSGLCCRRRRIRICCDELNLLVPFCNAETDKATTLQWTTAFLKYIQERHGDSLKKVRAAGAAGRALGVPCPPPRGSQRVPDRPARPGPDVTEPL